MSYSKFVLQVLYGNPKFHKPVADNMPKFRPTLSALKIPRCNLAKPLIPISEPLTHNKLILKQSFSFAKEVTSHCLPTFPQKKQ